MELNINLCNVAGPAPLGTVGACCVRVMRSGGWPIRRWVAGGLGGGRGQVCSRTKTLWCNVSLL